MAFAVCCAPEANPRPGWVGYICNLDSGHNGEHQAVVDGSLVASWSSDPAPSSMTHVPNLGDEYTPAEATLNRIFARLIQRIGAIIMTSADKAVQDVTAQLTKAKSEIDAEVAKLQDAGVSPESLAGLQAVSQSLDDANPDAAPAEPTPPADGATDTST